MYNCYSKSIDTPIGWIIISASYKGITYIHLLQEGIKYNKKIKMPKDKTVLQHINAAKFQLSEYFYGNRMSFDLPLDIKGTPFQQKVWQALLKIPYAHTTSYKDIAKKIGSPNAYRAVGQACGANPIPIIIPCHRVLSSDGSIGGYSAGIDIKKWLLSFEFSNIK